MNFKLILCAILLCFIPSMKGECRGKHHSTPTLSPLEQSKQSLLKNRQHLDLINYLIKDRGYKNYLEVGVADGQNFRSVIAERKIGVDPSPAAPATHRMTSDEFFKSNRETFDIIFIDGLHLYEQVLRDVENALACLNPGGIIIMHDCMPSTEEGQGRKPIPGAWNGDVWKAAAYIRMNLSNVHFCVLDMDWGCGILTPNSTQQLYPVVPIQNMDWNFYLKNKIPLLNVISVEQWMKSRS